MTGKKEEFEGITGFLRKLKKSPAFNYLKRDERAWFGLAVIITVVGVAIFAPLVAPYEINEQPGKANQPPSSKYLLGTDGNGNDVFSRLIYGSRVALKVGFLLVALEGGVGILLGLLAGYLGGNVDELIMRIADVALAFPGLVLAAAFVGFFGSGLENLIIALSLTGWAPFARMTRGKVLDIKQEDYVKAAKGIGEKDRNILFKYLLPNASSPLIVQATTTFPAALIMGASMSFLGLGVQPPTASWGYMLNQAQNGILSGYWWSAVFPGIAIIITVLGFNFLGDAFRDAIDPSLREYQIR